MFCQLAALIISKLAVESMAAGPAEVVKGIVIINKAGKSFEVIRTNVQSVTYEIGQISEASKVISQHANQVEMGIERVLEQTNENTASAQNKCLKIFNKRFNNSNIKLKRNFFKMIIISF